MQKTEAILPRGATLSAVGELGLQDDPEGEYRSAGALEARRGLVLALKVCPEPACWPRSSSYARRHLGSAVRAGVCAWVQLLAAVEGGRKAWSSVVERPQGLSR